MKNLIAIFVALSISTTSVAQCENGVCQVPTKAPVLQAVAAPLVSVLEAQPVRKVATAAVTMAATVPQVVRQVKPVRNITSVARKVVNRQPARSFARRIFCR